jgi:hypothetical protein
MSLVFGIETFSHNLFLKVYWALIPVERLKISAEVFFKFWMLSSYVKKFKQKGLQTIEKGPQFNPNTWKLPKGASEELNPALISLYTT